MRLEGCVVGANMGQPLALARVGLLELERRTGADAEGNGVSGGLQLPVFTEQFTEWAAQRLPPHPVSTDVPPTNPFWSTMRYLKPILLAAVLALPAQLAAQRERPELVIRVVDQTTGAAIPAARVAVSGNRRTALTGDSGLVRIAGLEPRKHFVTVERLGYTAERFVADMAPGGVLAVDVELAAAPVELRGVRGRAARQRPALRNVGFYERARQGFATIVDKEKIEGRKPANMLDLFRGLRGFRVALSGRSGEPRLFSSRGPLSLGKTNDSCSPAVFLDGSPFPSTEINLVPPESVEAIEAYPGIAGVPLRFSPNPSPCGSVFIWTRTGG